MPRHRFNEARAFLAGGLQDVSLTRPKLRWGVEVPWDRSQVFYVWFDALLNYYTALGFARGKQQDLTKEFWPATVHLIGKDILKFHTIYWPALLMAAGIEVPEHVFVHGFLLDRRREDEQVARQGHRPVRDHRGLRRRRAALLPGPRGHLRPGRPGLRGGVHHPLRDRAGQRLRQPGQPHGGDDQPLPRRPHRRHRARRRDRRRAGRADRRGLRRIWTAARSRPRWRRSGSASAG